MHENAFYFTYHQQWNIIIMHEVLQINQYIKLKHTMITYDITWTIIEYYRSLIVKVIF